MHVGRRDSFFTLLISLYYHASFADNKTLAADNETLTADRDALAVELADKNAERYVPYLDQVRDITSELHWRTILPPRFFLII